MQASHAWTPPGGTLGRILEETRRRLPSLDGTEFVVPPDKGWPSLRKALRKDAVAIIAELKRKSPSKGTLNSALDAATQVSAFERGGASAVSVLTEPSFFAGTMMDLQVAISAVELPILKKDFHVHESQLTEARMACVSAVLLIARALSPSELPYLMARARDLDLEAVVEVRTEAELERALDAGAEMIGVNSRDLETLEIDESVPRNLMPRIPPRVIGIWESGVQTPEDVKRAAECGADAVLVGSALSRSLDPESLVRSLVAVPRRARRD